MKSYQKLGPKAKASLKRRGGICIVVEGDADANPNDGNTNKSVNFRDGSQTNKKSAFRSIRSLKKRTKCQCQCQLQPPPLSISSPIHENNDHHSNHGANGHPADDVDDDDDNNHRRFVDNLDGENVGNDNYGTATRTTIPAVPITANIYQKFWKNFWLKRHWKPSRLQRPNQGNPKLTKCCCGASSGE